MNAIGLEIVKRYLRVTHSLDDALLEQLIAAAEDEAVRYLNRTELPTLPQDFPPDYDSSSSEIPEPEPSSEDPVAPSVIEAVCLLVKASYEATTPDEVAGYRLAAEVKLHPYRVRLGV